MIAAIVIVVVVLLAILAAGAAASIRVLREYERGVVFRLGRLMDQRGPGLVLLVPAIDRLVRVSLRTVTLRVPPQEIITRDNVPTRVTAVTYFRIVDASRAIVEIESYEQATLQISQTTLRSVLGGADLDTLLSEREHLNAELQRIIDQQTEPWGVKVTAVEIKDVEIPERMQHAIARQAEAERERRAKIINAEGEAQASARLAEAADVISANPVTIQLRYLQTLREMGSSQSTIVFPFPVDIFSSLFKRGGAADESAPAVPAPDATPAPPAVTAGPTAGNGHGVRGLSEAEANGEPAAPPPAAATHDPAEPGGERALPTGEPDELGAVVPHRPASRPRGPEPVPPRPAA